MDYRALYEKFQQEGCLKIENFLTLEEVEELRQGVEEVVKNMPDEENHVFYYYASGKKGDTDDYYLTAGDKIRYFFEEGAIDENGKFLMDKRDALNKIGYAMYWLHPTFKKHNFSQKIKDLMKNFHYQDPVVVQSMIIFKKPKIGEIVKPHQDSTFLYTDPPSCIGLWFPIEDATAENGCLWYVPGSHKEDVHVRFVRTPSGNPRLKLEGTLPNYRDDEWVCVPAKRGDCVVIHGSVMHKSGPNTTNKSRTIYTYHMVEKAAKWSPLNWLQPTDALPFPSVYEN